MEIILSSNSSKPIYTQITEQIKAQIMDGTLRARRSDPVYAQPGEVPARQCNHRTACL